MTLESEGRRERIEFWLPSLVEEGSGVVVSVKKPPPLESRLTKGDALRLH